MLTMILKAYLLFKIIEWVGGGLFIVGMVILAFWLGNKR